MQDPAQSTQPPAPWPRGTVLVSVAFTPTTDDTIAFYRYRAASAAQVADALRRQKHLGLIIGGVFVLLFLVVVAASKTSAGEWLEPYLRYGAPLTLIALTATLLPIVLLNGGKLSGKSMSMNMWEKQVRSGVIETDARPVRIDVLSTGMDVDRGTTRSWYDWATIQRVVRLEQHVLLFVTRDQAIIVPDRAFGERSAIAEFQLAIESHMRRDAGQTSAPPTIAPMP